MKNVTVCLFFAIIVFVGTSCKTTNTAITSSVKTPKNATVNVQEKKDFIFQNGAIGFSNQFSAARLNHVKAVNDATYSLMVLPENNPINPSPWYAFKLWSNKSQTVHLQLVYQHVAHRYNPKSSIDGKKWNRIDEVFLNNDSTVASFNVALTANDTTIIAAQELIDLPSSYVWVDSMAKHPIIQKQVIGNSINNNPIFSLHTKGASGKEIVVVLSRQHPPEVTGYSAMQYFVNKVLDESVLSKKFLERFEMIVIPTVNPENVTPHSEAFQAVVWHLLVSHPKLKANQTKWESASNVAMK